MTQSTESTESTESRGPLFWISAAAGWGLVAWGVRGALHHRIDTRPTELVRFFAGGLLAHDLVFAPVVVVAGVIISRATPGRWRAAVQAALILAGLVALFAYPEIRDYARILHNPTSLPHDYAANVAVVAGALAVLALAAAAAVGRRRSRRA